MSPKTKFDDLTVSELQDIIYRTVEDAFVKHDQLEDAYDLLLMKEVEDDERIPWAEVKESLKRAGKL